MYLYIILEEGEHMDDYINKLLDEHLGSIIEESRCKLIKADKTFLQDEKDLSELEQRYTSLNLSKSDRLVANDYIACLQTVEHRNADLSYLAGVRDTVKLLHSLGVIKKLEE